MGNDSTLTIQEIALLKTNPKKYYTIKTHDGTSMGKINNALNNFAQSQIGEVDKVGGKEHLQIYDSNGKPYFNTIKEGSTYQVSVPTDDLREEKNLHLAHNHTTLLEDGMPTMLSSGDTNILLEKNKDSDYIFQSITATSPSRRCPKVTLLRNNKFSEDDHPQFKKATEQMRDEYSRYREKFQNMVMKEEKKMVDEYMKEHPHGIRPFRFHTDAVNVAYKECGTLDQHFKSNGVYDELEKANCKLRITEQS